MVISPAVPLPVVALTRIIRTLAFVHPAVKVIVPFSSMEPPDILELLLSIVHSTSTPSGISVSATGIDKESRALLDVTLYWLA